MTPGTSSCATPSFGLCLSALILFAVVPSNPTIVEGFSSTGGALSSTTTTTTSPLKVPRGIVIQQQSHRHRRRTSTVRHVSQFALEQPPSLHAPTAANHHQPVAPSGAAGTNANAIATTGGAAADDTTAMIPSNALSPLETWCIIQLEKYYREALAMKCPFLRRRATDVLDSLDAFMRVVMIRQANLYLLGPPVSLRCQGSTCLKHRNLPLSVVAEIVRRDWRTDTNKGYYVTGRLNTTVYSDDCTFVGPDPDLPVKGLRKYLNVAKHLFDQRTSRSELLDLEVRQDEGTIVARWRMRGVLHLPWRPPLPTVTGTTTYHRNDEGLIHRHEETWDISVGQAFLKTLWPALAKQIWKKANAAEEKEDKEEEELCTVS